MVGIPFQTFYQQNLTSNGFRKHNYVTALIFFRLNTVFCVDSVPFSQFD